MNDNLVISSSPHIRTFQTVRGVMVDVLIALGPVVAVSILLFGYRALLTHDCSYMLAAMLAEALWLHQWNIFGDGSAAVTGFSLAMTCRPMSSGGFPPSAPLPPSSSANRFTAVLETISSTRRSSAGRCW